MNDNEMVVEPNKVPVLIVDDDAVTRGLLGNLLEQSNYAVLTAANGREAIEILKRQHVHLLITDWMMPEVSGLELCQWIRARNATRYVFILMLTSREDGGHDVVEALAAGADEFIRKPIRAEELTARLRSAERKIGLFSRDVTIYAMAQLADSRDPETGDHLSRIREYARLLTEAYARVAGRQVPPDYADLLYMTSPLHDIGKVGIPDSILLKPGQLSNAEFEIMKAHTTIGASTLDRALREFPAMEYLRTARDIALTHHERFDGTGYPDGRQGVQIPLAGRLVAVCDVYDALTSKRVYKSAKPHHVARAEIMRSAGSHFDPAMVEAFMKVEAAFEELAMRGQPRGPNPGEYL